MNGILMLEDGHSVKGEIISGHKEMIGEVILNTAVVGYQEMMTNPSNADKILVLTYPLIGNYGVAPKFNESKRVWLSGLVIKEESRTFSNWQAKISFNDYIEENGLFTLSRVDTRTLAVHLRQKGQMLGIVAKDDSNPKELLAEIETFRKKSPVSLLPEISVKKDIKLGKGKTRIAILDLGVTNSLLKQLENLEVAVTILPYNTTLPKILRLKPKGLIISSGPEDDLGLSEVVGNIKPLIGKIPMLGISAGFQVLAKALGAKIIKMKLGHHGVNYPIYNPAVYKGEITVQNHSYIVDADSLIGIKGVKITAYNLNDRTVEEIESLKFKLIGVQYDPTSPGFDEVNPILKRFLKVIIPRSR